MTDIKTHLFFPVPVHIVNFGQDAEEMNSALIRDIEKEREETPTQTRSAIKGWQSNGLMEEKYESFNELRYFINQVFLNTLPKIGYEKIDLESQFVCKEFWANVLVDAGAFHVPHIHGTGETLFAGVYYPMDYLHGEEEGPDIRASSVPQSGDLVLFDPASTEKRSVIPGNVDRYPYYGSEICIRPRKGNLIIFPSYLSHMVAPLWRTGITRMSISFSYMKKN